MRLKLGVSIAGLNPIMRVVLKYVERAFQDAGYESILTATTDGEHSPGSWHYFGLAIDYRIRHVTASELDAILTRIRQKLVPLGFEVLLHTGSHIHIEPSDALAKRLGLMP